MTRHNDLLIEASGTECGDDHTKLFIIPRDGSTVADGDTVFIQSYVPNGEVYRDDGSVVIYQRHLRRSKSYWSVDNSGRIVAPPNNFVPEGFVIHLRAGTGIGGQNIQNGDVVSFSAGKNVIVEAEDRQNRILRVNREHDDEARFVLTVLRELRPPIHDTLPSGSRSSKSSIFGRVMEAFSGFPIDRYAVITARRFFGREINDDDIYSCYVTQEDGYFEVKGGKHIRSGSATPGRHRYCYDTLRSPPNRALKQGELDPHGSTPKDGPRPMNIRIPPEGWSYGPGYVNGSPGFYKKLNQKGSFWIQTNNGERVYVYGLNAEVLSAASSSTLYEDGLRARVYGDLSNDRGSIKACGIVIYAPHRWKQRVRQPVFGKIESSGGELFIVSGSGRRLAVHPSVVGYRRALRKHGYSVVLRPDNDNPWQINNGRLYVHGRFSLGVPCDWAGCDKTFSFVDSVSQYGENTLLYLAQPYTGIDNCRSRYMLLKRDHPEYETLRMRANSKLTGTDGNGIVVKANGCHTGPSFPLVSDLDLLHRVTDVVKYANSEDLLIYLDGAFEDSQCRSRSVMLRQNNRRFNQIKALAEGNIGKETLLLIETSGCHHGPRFPLVSNISSFPAASSSCR